MSRWWPRRGIEGLTPPSGEAPASGAPAMEAAVDALLAARSADEALAALAAWPDGPARGAGWWFRHGRALRLLGRHDEALHSLGAALALDDTHVDAREALGNVHFTRGEHALALAAYDRVLARQPRRLDSLYNRGLALLRLHRPADALAAFDAVLQQTPDDAAAHVGRGNALLDLRRLKAAEQAYRDALRQQPEDPETLHNLGVVLQELRRPDEAAAAFEQVARLAPGFLQVDGKLLHARMLACDWHDHGALLARIEAGLARGEALADPFVYQGVSQRPDLQQVCARLAAARHAQPAERHLGSARRPQAGQRLRVGYVSGEFRQQATSVLMAELFECRDRQHVELIAFDNGWDDGSALRRRVLGAFDEVVPIAPLPDLEAARAVHRRDIDVLVDLNGYFGLARPGLFAWRPAPIQVNYLGFPGTTGAAWMDYILADRWVIPPGDERHYTEQVVRLPGCYQPNDSQRRAPPCLLSRSDAGLPDDGFVFCCFNNTYKITPAAFAVWMSLLRQVEGGVLWLLGDNRAAEDNLRRSAVTHGVAPQRLVFASRAELPQHLARHALADLFLDTLPCNAHTTASDALCAGLPLLTCTGPTFSGRVAASLLHAIGLDELIAADLAAYERQALRLATHPRELAALRARVAAASNASLFGSRELSRHLEVAFQHMVDRLRRGLPAQAFDL